jgi:hypothetical protein
LGLLPGCKRRFPRARFFGIIKFMGKLVKGIKKSRGRPKTTGIGTQIGTRWPWARLVAIDEWRSRQDGPPSRTEAIRRLVELGLSGSAPAKHTSRKAAAKASDMAAHQIDKLANPAMPEGERRARKRRIIKGPREFREMRGDQPKRKR